MKKSLAKIILSNGGSGSDLKIATFTFLPVRLGNESRSPNREGYLVQVPIPSPFLIETVNQRLVVQSVVANNSSNRLTN